ncbi:MAG TPA: hypothetical protein VMW41_05030 [Candidatus Bathyarchaeia archaeon]|nr:hypothetical protein [Candidatus Bathyarchaeia archaeon]
MNKKRPKKFFYVVSIFFSLVLFLALVQIYVSHRLATAGKVVAELENEVLRTREENQKLCEGIDQKGSLSVISQKAQALGFRPLADIVYLTSGVSVALND